eukprot:360365-Chlamydomonas_euryale.AAC.7
MVKNISLCCHELGCDTSKELVGIPLLSAKHTSRVTLITFINGQSHCQVWEEVVAASQGQCAPRTTTSSS